ncbi:octanoyl-[acyl-carrier-protein]:protein N-octanoyltransferase LIPT2, mitochondrial-like [Clavelina lepadiformis]|uniref:octanoyl-[acyl-carrier-protein]:protein N-octanoyltransferase LIPT2, mitochondrial-like n=1 Tax=Clavelina lepadiformis TaxID=159417 RepID=UPI0040419D49
MHVIKGTSPLFQCFYLGKIKYLKALKLQETLVQWQTSHLNNCNPILLLLQHYPVYTVGIRSSVYSKQEENHLLSLGADFVRTKRGGLITFHGPGQLVAYPIFNLKIVDFGVRKYVETLEEVIINLSGRYGIQAERSPHTGVWVGNNKLCAMGINCQGRITSHGLALNCNTDMKWFSHIVACGIHGKGVTSFTEILQKPVTVKEVLPLFLDEFSRCFNCDMTPLRHLPEAFSLADMYEEVSHNKPRSKLLSRQESYEDM